MASNSLVQVENWIRCGLCSQLYDDPRLLPCLHTYCFRCINRNLSTNKTHFVCPACDGSKTHRNDIDSLPSNLLIRDIMELYELMKCPPMCLRCDTSPADCICNDCMHNKRPMYYCSECYQTIHSERVFQDHSKMRIHQKSSEIIFCEIHGDEKLKYWCQKCHTSVCSDCLLLEHQGHSYNLIKKVSEELKNKIPADLEMIQSSFNHEIKEINISFNEIITNTERNKRQVSKAMASLRQMIDEHEKQMLQDIENFQREETQLFEEYKTRLENQLKDFHLQKGIFDLLISLNDQIRLLKNQSNFLDYIDQTNDKLRQSQKPIGIDYHINGLEQIDHLREQILQCGRVMETPKRIIPVDEDQTSQIQKLIARYQTSEEVDFSIQLLTDQNIQFALQILEKTSKMVTLNLSNNQIGPHGIENLLDVLQTSKTLSVIEISNNEIADDGTKYLADFLKTNKTVTTLYLNGNGISEQGTLYLTDVLKTNTTLTVLDLKSNQIGSIGAQYLADALRKNHTLTTLYLSDNQIGNQGALYLANGLHQNTTLTLLTLSDNQINHEARRRALEILKANKRLLVVW